MCLYVHVPHFMIASRPSTVYPNMLHALYTMVCVPTKKRQWQDGLLQLIDLLKSSQYYSMALVCVVQNGVY